MSTLLTIEVPDGVAKRLAREFASYCEGLAALRETGAVPSTLPLALIALRDSGEPQAASRDWHAVDADLRALIWYAEIFSGRAPVEGWSTIFEDRTVIPWGYGRNG